MGPEHAIRVVIGGLEIGGTEGHLAQVLPQLRQRGWSPYVVTLLGLGPVAEHLRESDIPVSELASAQQVRRLPRWLRRSLGSLLLVVDLYRELRVRPRDLTWMLLPQAYLLTMVAAWFAGHRGPLVMSRRSLNRYQQHYPGMRIVERVFHRRLAAVIANSTAVKDELESLEGVSRKRLVLIHNGIDSRRFERHAPCSVVRRQLGVPEDAWILCTIANIIAYKGHRDLLLALALIRDRLPRWRLLCVGGGDSRALACEASRLGLDKNVLWLGLRTDGVDLLAASDIGILASHEEGFSNAVLECMAAGLPMVATRVGGNSDAVLDGHTGILVPPHDPPALAQAILRLAEDQEFARRMGQAGRLRVAHVFSLERCVAEYDRLFSAVRTHRPLPATLPHGGCEER